MQVEKVITEKLNQDEIVILTELFDFVIPPGKEGQLPGAGFLCKMDILFSSEDLSFFTEIVKQLSDDSNSIFGKEFVCLSTDECRDLLRRFQKKSLRSFNELAFKIINYYYTNDRILEAIGIKSRPPFPDGNYVEEGDLLLFEDVYLRGQVYRE